MSTENPKNNPIFKIKEFWLKYEPKIILIFAFILVTILAFEAGILNGQNSSKSAVIIEKPSDCTNTPDTSQNIQKSQNLTPQEPSATIGDENQKNCQFVASKNSDKYHKSTCGWAKRIKQENKVCFATEQEAINKGLKQAGCCFK